MGMEESEHNPSTLTPQQSALLASFDQLNEEGQTKAVEYVEDLVLTGRYKNVLRLSWAQRSVKIKPPVWRLCEDVIMGISTNFILIFAGSFTCLHFFSSLETAQSL